MSQNRELEMLLNAVLDKNKEANFTLVIFNHDKMNSVSQTCVDIGFSAKPYTVCFVPTGEGLICV